MQILGGIKNVAIGKSALGTATTAGGNTAVGFEALYTTATGPENTAMGFMALKLNTSGGNTAFGYEALLNNSSAGYNVAVGYGGLNRKYYRSKQYRSRLSMLCYQHTKPVQETCSDWTLSAL